MASTRRVTIRLRPRKPPWSGYARAWLTDAIFGWLIGSAVVAMLGEAILLSVGSSADGLTRVVFVVLGGVLGIAFMRLVRSREAATAGADERRRGPRDRR
jgi:hypothetical protein